MTGESAVYTSESAQRSGPDEPGGETAGAEIDEADTDEADTDGADTDHARPLPSDEARELRAELDQLRQAMETRPVIDQARGVLMASWHCTPQTAWQILVDTSQHTNTKLRKVAAMLTRSTQGEPMPDWLRKAVLASRARVTGRAAGTGSAGGTGRAAGSGRAAAPPGAPGTVRRRRGTRR
ncbi:ANTAR domain-containing protein [Streptomyces albus subsp. chlorinus]|uniref:ANTAR domain-containing protein n=1 Tax=Streptomyces albus TaxID=1888 RepID=UPI0031F6D3DF